MSPSTRLSPMRFSSLPHQHVMVDSVEKLLEVDVNHNPLPFLDVPLRLAHRIVCVAPRSETVAVLRQGSRPEGGKRAGAELAKRPGLLVLIQSPEVLHEDGGDDLREACTSPSRRWLQS